MKDSSSRNLDALDIKLIEELEADGRQTNAELARLIGTSKATARRKLNALIDDGIIRIVAVADPQAQGYKTVATMGIKVKPGEVDSVANKLASYVNVPFVIITAGRYDIITIVMFREPEDLSQFIRNELGEIAGLISAETMVYLKIKKFSFTFTGENQFQN